MQGRPLPGLLVTGADPVQTESQLTIPRFSVLCPAPRLCFGNGCPGLSMLPGGLPAHSRKSPAWYPGPLLVPVARSSLHQDYPSLRPIRKASPLYLHRTHSRRNWRAPPASTKWSWFPHPPAYTPLRWPSHPLPLCCVDGEASGLSIPPHGAAASATVLLHTTRCTTNEHKSGQAQGSSLQRPDCTG